MSDTAQIHKDHVKTPWKQGWKGKEVEEEAGKTAWLLYHQAH